jgi:Kef-type K+ transport system membrane component KefB
MTSIELLVLLILAVMAVPEVCSWLGRPTLAYPMFVCFGLVVGPLLRPDVTTMILEVGEIGFVLLLFEVGMEIDIPLWRELGPPLRFLLKWLLPQYPLLVALARFAGLPWLDSFIAAAALGACSLGMAHAAWKHYPGLDGASRVFVLHVMVLLEVLAVVLLATETAVLGDTPAWMVALKLAGMALVVYTCSRIGVHITKLMKSVLERTTRWRLHFVALLVLALCAVGERFGLSGPKTAFFLGLFSSRVRHDGRSLEEYMAPISRRFLIPLFFTALGTQVPVASLLSLTAVMAICSAGLILVFRHFLHERFAPTGGDDKAFLLLCPNFTLIALAAKALLAQPNSSDMATWLLLTGLVITLFALAALPAVRSEATETRSGFA